MVFEMIMLHVFRTIVFSFTLLPVKPGSLSGLLEALYEDSLTFCLVLFNKNDPFLLGMSRLKFR